MRPLIGIPCYSMLQQGSSRPMYGLGKAYVHALEQAGAMPVLIPPSVEGDDPRDLLVRLDGLLLSGGNDVDPALYGEKSLSSTVIVERERDDLEIPLARFAVEREMPVFGICRGMQLLNVALGGTLYQDIATQRPDALKHDHHSYEGPRDARAHSIHVASGSRLAEIVGPTTHVNSFHHQALKDLAPGLLSTAVAEDGLLEAVELPNHPFALAVQYHPEELVASDPGSRALFAAFVAACAAGRPAAAS
jgi:putative glutamine amidotransferase